MKKPGLKYILLLGITVFKFFILGDLLSEIQTEV